MEERRAPAFGDGLQSRPQRGIPSRPRKQTPRQRTVVKTGAAGEDGETAAGMNVPHDRGRVARKLRRGVLVGRLDDVDKVVRDAAAIGGRDLVGADVEAAVHRRRIAVDDFAAEPLRDGQGQGALSRRSRAENRNERSQVSSLKSQVSTCQSQVSISLTSTRLKPQVSTLNVGPA